MQSCFHRDILVPGLGTVSLVSDTPRANPESIAVSVKALVELGGNLRGGAGRVAVQCHCIHDDTGNH